MAVRHQLVRRSPREVWAVLADPTRYGEWAVGPSKSTPLDRDWPEVGARLRYTVRLGPWSTDGVLGTARIFLQLRPWGAQTLVVCDEHPLRGLGGTLHNPAVETLLQLRHRGMPARLAKAVERNGTGARRA
ncbi:SRPBCC family protein [Streptomyces goshikiensis]|uniref:SRPBCC family protein n=1 Tax=Streptomyces goshikiensis TaxID=1942 RepID=UPI00371173B6